MSDYKLAICCYNNNEVDVWLKNTKTNEEISFTFQTDEKTAIKIADFICCGLFYDVKVENDRRS